MKKILVAIVALTIMSNVCEARTRRRSYPTKSYGYTNYKPADNKTAQGVANTMASRNYVSHFGGHPGMYEGCGSGFSKDQAYNNCCYSRSGMKTVDVGYAQSTNGMWYCCRRYVR